MVSHRPRAGSERRNYRTTGFHDGGEESAVGSGIIDVDARSDEGDRSPFRRDGGGMGFGIYPRRASRYDGRTASNEGGNETFGHFPTVRRGFPRSDDRYRQNRFRNGSTDGEKERTPWHVQESGRIFGIGFENDPRAGGFGTFERRDGLGLEVSGRKQGQPVFADSGTRKGGIQHSRG